MDDEFGLENPYSASTSFIMPNFNVNLHAEYMEG